MSSGLPRCVVADDHPALLAAVSEYLAENGFEVAASVSDGTAAAEAAAAHRPDVVLLDYRMPPLLGPELLRSVAAAAPAAALAVYTADADEEVVAQALSAGARAIVLKEAPLPDLVRALNAVLRGDPYIDPALGALAVPGRRAPVSALTEREASVLELLAEGLTYDEIGARLSLSAETVRTHVQKACDRLGATTRTNAVATAIRLGLIA